MKGLQVLYVHGQLVPDQCRPGVVLTWTLTARFLSLSVKNSELGFMAMSRMRAISPLLSMPMVCRYSPPSWYAASISLRLPTSKAAEQKCCE